MNRSGTAWAKSTRSGATRSGATRSGAPRTGASSSGTARSGARLRILGGTLRGRRLAVVSGVRPTEARLREALFSIWQDPLAGCLFLDLFAGSGAVGLEALSRGARRAVFVESSPRVLVALRRNLAGLAPEASEVRRGRLSSGMPAGTFDLIFADPPYAFGDYEGLLRGIEPALAAGGDVAIEHSSRVELPAAVAALRRLAPRRYGDSCLSLYRMDGND